MKVEESLNVTFDESPPPTKLSPLVDDDVGEEEAIRNNTKVVNNNNEEDESKEVDEFSLFLDCLRIIESKSKVRNSRNKPVVTKVSLSTSTPGVSPDVAELKDMVKALLLDKKTQAPAPVKAVEESCVTCGGAHSYRNCPATDGNVYRDNIQEYVSQSAAANYNQGNTSYRAPIANSKLDSHRTVFLPFKTRKITKICYNQYRGNNYNQAKLSNRPPDKSTLGSTKLHLTQAPAFENTRCDKVQMFETRSRLMMRYRNMQDQNHQLAKSNDQF
ncbi:hypothetical protein Tco_0523157 [Tanacetum coccineum]